MKTAFKIREMRRGDFKDIINAYFSYYDEIKSNPNLGLTLNRKKPSLKEESKWFADSCRAMNSGNSIALVAEVNGRVVGLCDVRRIRPGTSADHMGLIGIAIIKAQRSKGIGTALMSQAIARSRGKFEKLILSVYGNNSRATTLYRKMGFREYGMLKNSQKRGKRYFDERYMYLDLD